MAVHRETCRRKELAGHHTCWLVVPGNHQQLNPVRYRPRGRMLATGQNNKQ